MLEISDLVIKKENPEKKTTIYFNIDIFEWRMNGSER